MTSPCRCRTASRQGIAYRKHRDVIAGALPRENLQAALSKSTQFLASVTAALAVSCSGAHARPEPVNKPELLPNGPPVTVIDVAGFLTDGEEVRLKRQIADLEADTGFRLRVLAQNYPNTPGLAVRDYWKVDDNTIVFVADPGFGDILNFNVGAGVDLEVPKSFWTRLAGKYGNKFYWKQEGEEAAINSAISAINTCLREPPGRLKCSTIQGN